jgi:transcriptional antiterminator NusG
MAEEKAVEKEEVAKAENEEQAVVEETNISSPGLAPELAAKAEWYVISTYSGYEDRVKRNIEQRIVSMHMENKIFRILIPEEEVMDGRRGRRAVRPRKFFPGYVLIYMILDEDSWYVVRNTPKVTSFISEGKGSQPIPLSEGQVEDIIGQFEGRKGRLRPRVLYEAGDSVKILDGPFADFDGQVEEVDEERGRLKAVVSIFGRSTPVELDFSQVEKET